MGAKDKAKSKEINNKSTTASSIVTKASKVVQRVEQRDDEGYSDSDGGSSSLSTLSSRLILQNTTKQNLTNNKKSNGRSNHHHHHDAYHSNDEEEEAFGQISFKIDLIASTLFVLSAATRFYNLTYPHNIVFDELHYGKYASLYLRRIFFFDPHPPLGKQLIAASTYFFEPSYNGTFRFDRIGTLYPNWVPVFGMRFIPALAGSFVPSACYMLCREIGISPVFAVLAGLVTIFDNALLIQSRYILMEMPMIVFGLASLIFALKSTKQSNYLKNLIFISMSGFFGTLSLSIKYIGAFYLGLSGLIIFWNFWTRWVPRKDFSTLKIISKFFSAYGVFYLTFFTTYVALFYIHLSVLTNAGPHDSVMTSAFQASLKGGLASIIKGQPVQVAHGSQVTLRHSLGRACWMHSHAHNYPIKYSDGRGSSHQQQVTCYSFKDVNNWWIIKRPLIDNLAVNETKDVIRHGDEIHIVHGMTGRLLNSHDVAAPVTPQNQEVSCYIDHNVSMPAEPLWRLEIIGGCGDSPLDSSSTSQGCEWHAVKSTVRLVHVSTGQALRMTGKQLPKWGFHQHEIVTDRILVQDDTVWNVEEHRYTKSEKDREKELLEAEMIPTKPTVLTFWQKFLELQWKMLLSSGSSTQTESHAYASYPSEWLLLSRGIAYWIGVGNNAQIHLLGNPGLWLSATFGLLIHSSLLVFYVLRRRRLCFDIDEESWATIRIQSGVCLGGYLLTYVYHFCVDRTLFLHHYLPSYVFKIILFIGTLNHLYLLMKNKATRSLFVGAVLVWFLLVLYTFSKFVPTSYGSPPLSRAELESLKWVSTWDFIIQTNA